MSTHARPVCSVCIANYNGVALIDACIQSVLAQDCGFAIEIIVHDDASTDGSVQAIRTHYPEVKIIESVENVGFCISNNRMVNAAQGDYILLLNNDAALFPDALRTLHETALRLKKAAILGLPQYDASTGELIDIGSRFDLFLNPVPNRDPAQQEIGMVIGACLWLPRALWDELGGFPDWFGSLAEDMLLCCLARLYGYRVIALPRSGVGKSLGGGKVLENRLSTKIARRAASERNKNYVMCLTYPAPYLQLLLPLHVFLLVFEGIILATLKRDPGLFRNIYLASVRALWQHRRLLASRRHDIQNRRKCGRTAFFIAFEWMPHKLRLLLRHGIPEIAK
ncbi:MAG: glycosyltransferase [Burkholderiales bacterium]